MLVFSHLKMLNSLKMELPSGASEGPAGEYTWEDKKVQRYSSRKSTSLSLFIQPCVIPKRVQLYGTQKEVYSLAFVCIQS